MVRKIVLGVIFLTNSVQLYGGIESLLFEISDGNLSFYLDICKELEEECKKIELIKCSEQQETVRFQQKTIAAQSARIQLKEEKNKKKEALKIKKARQQLLLPEIQNALSVDGDMEKQC